MCGFAGFADIERRFLQDRDQWFRVLSSLSETMARRGPDEDGMYLKDHVALSHRRLAVRDLVTGRQPMVRRFQGREFAITYNGELYNMEELKMQLKEDGCDFHTASDTEVILAGFVYYGMDWVEKLNGIFAFAIWDEEGQRLILCRDRAGIKPLFYTERDGATVFASEIKALFQFPGASPVVDRKGLCEVFGLGPARTHGSGVFRNVHEVPPGHFLQVDRRGKNLVQYWDLKSRPHEDSLEETVEKTAELIRDAIHKQMVSDVPVCTFLSGGVDSSVVTAYANSIMLQEAGEPLHTFSFDFAGNDEFFKSNAFQPDRDRPWVDKLKDRLQTRHTYLECDSQTLADYLYKAVDAKDLPGMADVDASLLYFCEQVAADFKVTLTGECADEIFGGYPWFHRKEMFETDLFPWSSNLEVRQQFFKADVKEALNLEAYVQEKYWQTIQKTPVLAGETGEEKRRRELAYLNIKWFMSTLLDRMDRTSMYAGLEARVPYADHRIMEYVFNVPWDIKCRDGMVKHLLRKASEGILPDEFLYRKKSPYPKTYNPAYEQIVHERLKEVLGDGGSPLHEILEAEKIQQFMQTPSDYGRPWYGQLMAGPQMAAYLLQMDYWLRKYKIRIVL